MHEGCQRIGHLGQRVSWQYPGEPLYHAQPISQWKSSVRDIQTQKTQKQEKKYEVKPQYEEPSKHSKSCNIGSHHFDDSVGLFGHDTSVGQSQRGSQSGHQSINLAQDIQTGHGRTHGLRKQISPGSKFMAEGFKELKYRSAQQQKNARSDFSRNLRTPAASRFLSNADSGSKIGATLNTRIKRRLITPKHISLKQTTVAAVNSTMLTNTWHPLTPTHLRYQISSSHETSKLRNDGVALLAPNATIRSLSPWQISHSTRLHQNDSVTLNFAATHIAVDTTPIRSTTRTETHSSGCTRITDEFCTNGFSSSSWPETNFRRQRGAAHGGGGGVREERRGRLASRKSHFPKSSSRAQHIELSIRATSWRSNSDIASVNSIGYPRMSASGESSTMMHRLLHASGSHPIPTPGDPK
ncbi:hypothetical protein F511_23332 [Dorcoceras hygrometricum]|uniref:Uncharacterized protein n=1 Tax=Dorcoceras hygrometricum TaxID=472368 RepID=A0A2Z7AB52_9LAMI|nr:hypothetical protein F511_23332 [Dorcoceras hygrometricum]